MTRHFEVEQHPLHSLRVDGGTQPRLKMDLEHIERLKDAIQEGRLITPVIVFRDAAGLLWLADGFHRRDAYLSAGKTEITCNVFKGERRDAVLYSVGTNADHGLPRSVLDKRRAVETLLEDPEWSLWSDSQIAKQCKVSQPYVGAIRKRLAEQVGAKETESGSDEFEAVNVRTYVNKHGQKKQMRVDTIGEKPNPKAEPKLASAEAVPLVVTEELPAGGPPPKPAKESVSRIDVGVKPVKTVEIAPKPAKTAEIAPKPGKKTYIDEEEPEFDSGESAREIFKKLADSIPEWKPGESIYLDDEEDGATSVDSSFKSISVSIRHMSGAAPASKTQFMHNRWSIFPALAMRDEVYEKLQDFFENPKVDRLEICVQKSIYEVRNDQ